MWRDRQFDRQDSFFALPFRVHVAPDARIESSRAIPLTRALSLATSVQSADTGQVPGTPEVFIVTLDDTSDHQRNAGHDDVFGEWEPDLIDLLISLDP
jgi:hypothetical protein